MLMDFLNFNVDLLNSKAYKSSHFSQTYLFCFPFDSEFNALNIDTHLTVDWEFLISALELP